MLLVCRVPGSAWPLHDRVIWVSSPARVDNLIATDTSYVWGPGRREARHKGELASGRA